MRTVLTSIHVLLQLLRASTQIINNAQPGYMPYYQPQRQYYDEYDYRRWGPARGRVYRRGGGKFPEYSIESNYEYDRYRKCKCSCKSCENIRPCCVSVCVNCNPQSNLVFVPYPVPLVVTVQSKSPSNSISTITTSTTTKAPTTTTRTTSPTTTITVATEVTTYSTPLFPKSIREKSLDQESDYEVSTFPFFENKKLSYLIKKKPACLRGRCKLKNYRRLDYIDGSLRNNDVEYNRDIRHSPTQENDKYYTIKFPSRSNWEPRFGIIPIPDKLALKFMTHLRDMKLQNLEKENVKPP